MERVEGRTTRFNKLPTNYPLLDLDLDLDLDFDLDLDLDFVFSNISSMRLMLS